MTSNALRSLLTIDALVGLATGLTLVLVPDRFLSIAGVSTDASGIVVARLYGGELLGFSTATWLARAASARRGPIVIGHVVNESLTAIVIALGLASGIGGPVLAVIAAGVAILAIAFWVAASRL